MILWMTTITVSVALLVLSAGAKLGDPRMAYVHMFVAAAVAIFFALIAIRDTRKIVEANGSRPAIAASSARYMGYVWAWGALALLISYGFGIVEWNEWLHFFLAFAIAGAAALFFANLLQRDANQGKVDETILNVSRYLGYIQLFGMLAVMIGLLVDGKMTRFLIPRHGDWAANNIFFFGALAIAAISAYGLKVSSGKEKA